MSLLFSQGKIWVCKHTWQTQNGTISFVAIEEHIQIVCIFPISTLRLSTRLLQSLIVLCIFFIISQDEKYWNRRYKNNEAAKRSRDARRLKENQITVRAAFLEKENSVLRQEVAKIRQELSRYRNILTKYESQHGAL